MMAKAVANATTASFISVVGSEFVQKYLGEVRPRVQGECGWFGWVDTATFLYVCVCRCLYMYMRMCGCGFAVCVCLMTYHHAPY